MSYKYTGSGSSYLYGFFDQEWREGMTKDEAEVCAMIFFNVKVFSGCLERDLSCVTSKLYQLFLICNILFYTATSGKGSLSCHCSGWC